MTIEKLTAEIAHAGRRKLPHVFRYQHKTCADGKRLVQMRTEGDDFQVVESALYIKCPALNYNRLAPVSLSGEGISTFLFQFNKEPISSVRFVFKSDELHFSSNDLELAYGYFLLAYKDEPSAAAMTFCVWTERDEQQSSCIINAQRRFAHHLHGIHRLMEDMSWGV